MQFPTTKTRASMRYSVVTKCSSPRGGSFTDTLSDRLVLCDRYIVSKEMVLGEGSSAIVLKGLDRDTKLNVAVKFYLSTGEKALEDFKRAIKVSQLLHEGVANTMRISSENNSRSGRRASCNIESLEDALQTSGVKKDACELMMSLDVASCFVKVLDYSHDDEGPGIDDETGMLFLVQELGSVSLEDKLEQRKGDLDAGNESACLRAEEVKDLFWSLVCITFGLHFCGYVHLDIKPLNIMEFDGDGGKHWKLIDLDGATLANRSISLESDRLSFTQVYMPPELAKAFCEKAAAAPRILRSSTRSRLLSKGRVGPEPQPFSITTSRTMDVWSVAMCMLQAIFLVPVLEPVLENMKTEYGDASGDLKYYHYLSSSDNEIISGKVKDVIMTRFGEDICELLEGMLQKDPAERFCMAKCLTHHCFHVHRNRLMGAHSSTQLNESKVEAMLAKCGSGAEVKRKSSACAVM